jgi:hypothetical protein
MQCDVIYVIFACQTKSNILIYRKDNKVLEKKLHYDFKLTLQFNNKKYSRLGTLKVHGSFVLFHCIAEVIIQNFEGRTR